MKLQYQLTINMLLIGLLPTLILAGAGGWLAEERLKKHINEELQYLTAGISREIRTQLHSFVRETRHLAESQLIIEHVRQANKRYADDPQQIIKATQQIDTGWIAAKGDVPLAKEIANNSLSAFLHSYQQQHPERYGELLVTDVHGNVVAMTRVLSDYYQGDEQWWNDSYYGGRGGIFFDDRGYDESAGAVVMGVSMPVRDAQRVIGILKISFTLRGMLQAIDDDVLYPTDHLMILRDDGTVLFSSRGDLSVQKMDPPFHAHIQHAGIVQVKKAGRNILSSQVRVKTPYIIMSRSRTTQGEKSETWQARNWYVMLHSDAATAYQSIRQFHALAGLLGTLILCSVLVTGLRLGRVLSAPVQKLHSGIALVRQGALHHRVKINAGGEIGALATAFNDMTAELEKTLTSRDVLRHEIELRKTIEADLRESEQRFRGTFEQAAVGIAHVGLDGSWLRVNQRLCEIVGYSEAELLEKNFQEIRQADALHDDLVEVRKLIDGETDKYSNEKRYIRKDGSLVWINMTVTLVNKADGSPDYFICVIEDIDEKKKMRDELQLLNQQLEKRVATRTTELTASKVELEQTLKKLYETEEQMLQAEKMAAMGTFAAGIAHELNNPLTGVLNYVQYARDRIDDEKLKAYLDKAEQNTLRAAKVVQNMLNYSRQGTTTEQETDVNKVIEQAIEVMRPELNKEHIALELEVQNNLTPIKANPDTLQQVLINLMSNARDAMENRTDKRLVLRAVEKDGVIKVSIKDNGDGIPKKIGKQIFDPFFTTKNTAKGTGLGLSLCQRIISNLGGSISFQSEIGKGTTFDIYIPVQQVNNKGMINDAQHTGHR